VNCHAADLLSFQMNLTNMDATTHQNPKRRDRVGNSRSAAYSPCRTVENADKPIPAVSDFHTTKLLDLVPGRGAVPIEQNTPIPIAYFRHSLRRVDDIGHQDRDKHAVVVDLGE
jgi:hypothetical protein